MKRRRAMPVFLLVGGCCPLVFGAHCGRVKDLTPEQLSPTHPVLRYYQEVHNEKRLEVIPDLFTDDYVAYGPSGDVSATGREGELEHMRESIAFFTDLSTEIEDVLADPPRVAVRWIGRGTHQGRIIVLPGMSLFEVRGTKIYRAWHFYDNLHSLRQLGYTLSPPP